LARIDAAEMACTLSSPSTTAWARIAAFVNCGQRLPSIRAMVGIMCSCSTARRIANMVACRMLMVSISWCEHSAMAQARACSRMMGASSSRRASVSFLESRRPSIGRFGSRMTAAANTGPASGPRPASSTPQTMSSSVNGRFFTGRPG
jgi:hypothetical protein